MVHLERYEILFISAGFEKLMEVSNSKHRRLLDNALEAPENLEYETIKQYIKELSHDN